jgi:hypothetical protein
MKGFGIEIKNNLLDPKHITAMGSSVWEYMWCLDKMTKIDDDGLGYVLGGKPIKLDEVKKDLGKDTSNISLNLHKLVKAGYINLKRTGYGNIITVNKAKKSSLRTGDNTKSDMVQTPDLNGKNTKSIIDNTVDITVRHISPTPSGKTSKTGLIPCSDDELLDVSNELKISRKEVERTHQIILNKIQAGEFKNKTVYFTLKNWLIMGMQRGTVQTKEDGYRHV